jgi:hypothetical protein
MSDPADALQEVCQRQAAFSSENIERARAIAVLVHDFKEVMERRGVPTVPYFTCTVRHRTHPSFAVINETAYAGECWLVGRSVKHSYWAVTPSGSLIAVAETERCFGSYGRGGDLKYEYDPRAQAEAKAGRLIYVLDELDCEEPYLPELAQQALKTAACLAIDDR